MKLFTDDDVVVVVGQRKRGLRSGGRAGIADRSPRRRRHLLRVLQNNARMEIREYILSIVSLIDTPASTDHTRSYTLKLN